MHRNQLLFTKFELMQLKVVTTDVWEQLASHELKTMTSKVQPAANSWTDDVKVTSRVQPAADCWTVDGENLGPGCDIFGRQKTKSEMLKGEVFRMNNKTVVEFGFRMIWRILQISEVVIQLGLRPLWITPSLICRILQILREPNSIIANSSDVLCFQMGNLERTCRFIFRMMAQWRYR